MRQEFPGTLLSTGTEDYFDSAWYFNAGEFHLPVSGFTHFNQSDNQVAWSAYRFHEMDPLLFNNGCARGCLAFTSSSLLSSCHGCLRTDVQLPVCVAHW